MKLQRNVTYHKHRKKIKKNRKEHNWTSTYHNIDDGGQAMGEEMRHVQMSK